MPNRAQKVGALLAEYYSSKQGMVQGGSVLVTVVGLLAAKSRIAAFGIAAFGFVVFPVTTVNQWRAVRRLDKDLHQLRRQQRESIRQQQEEALPKPPVA